MRVSITISGLTRLLGDDLAALLDLARVADDAGIHQLILPDHVIMGPRLDRYPFAERFPYPPEEPWPEPLVTLAAFAGATERVRLGTGVLIAPLRPAALLAKAAATVDVLSGGRLDLGIGSGWQSEEFDAVGVPFAGRGSRLVDTARACRALWNDAPPVSFSSATVSFRDVWCLPRPVQAGGVPLWFGGPPTATTAERVAELGAGWMPLPIPEAELRRGIELIRAACEARHRDPAEVGVRAGLPVVLDDRGRLDLDRTTAPVPALEAMGATIVSLGLGRFLGGPADVVRYLRDLGSAFAG